MGIVEKFRAMARLGKGASIAEQLAAASEAHARAGRERKAVAETIRAAAATRERLLLSADDDSDAAIDALEAQMVRDGRNVERLAAVERQLAQDVEALRARHRQSEWSRRRDEIEAAELQYLRAVRACRTEFEKLLDTLDTARGAGFNTETAAYLGIAVAPPTPEQIALFEDTLTHIRDSRTAPRRAKASLPAPTTPLRAAPRVAPPPTLPPPQRLPRAAAAPNAGETAVTFVRHGVELPDGTLSIPGDTVCLPITTARSLCERGAATEVANG